MNRKAALFILIGLCCLFLVDNVLAGDISNNYQQTKSPANPQRRSSDRLSPQHTLRVRLCDNSKEFFNTNLFYEDLDSTLKCNS